MVEYSVNKRAAIVLESKSCKIQQFFNQLAESALTMFQQFMSIMDLLLHWDANCNSQSNKVLLSTFQSENIIKETIHYEVGLN